MYVMSVLRLGIVVLVLAMATAHAAQNGGGFVGAGVSVTPDLDEETFWLVRELVREGRFRNKSHAFEYAVQKLRGETK